MLICLSVSAYSESENNSHHLYLVETSSSPDSSKNSFFHSEVSPDVDDFSLTSTVSDYFSDISPQKTSTVFCKANGISPEPACNPPENL